MQAKSQSLHWRLPEISWPKPKLRAIMAWGFLVFWYRDTKYDIQIVSKVLLGQFTFKVNNICDMLSHKINYKLKTT